MFEQVKVISILTILVSPFGFIFLLKTDFQSIINTLRINLTPNILFLDKWKNPPEPVATEVYLFNVTNSERFLSGEDEKLNIEEIGPIIYFKTVEQKDVEQFKENSTLSYTTTFKLSFPVKENIPGILNKTLVFPNVIALAMASIVHNQINNFITRAALNMILKSEKVFVRESVYNILWNFTCPTFERIKFMIPRYLFPRENAGILYNYVYPEYIRFNVNYGSKHGYNKFFQINTVNGKPFIPGYSYSQYKRCTNISISGSTDGSGITPFLNKSSRINFYQYMLPVPFPTRFKKQLSRGILNVYEFAVDDAIYFRSNLTGLDCFSTSGNIKLQDGLMDTSAITFGIPFALSPPHFLNFNGSWNYYLKGLNARSPEHYGYIIVEPITGVALEISPVVQVNMVISKLNLNSEINMLSGKILPLVWVKYHIEADNMIPLFLYVHVVTILIPLLQNILIFGIGLLWIFECYKTTNRFRAHWRKRKELEEVQISFLVNITM